MTFQKFTILSLILIVLFACGKNIKLTDKDFRWVPYKGNEILVYTSNTGDTDTLFLKGPTRESAPTDPLDVFPTNCDIFSIGMKYYDKDLSNYNRNYQESDFINLSIEEKNEAYLSIHFIKNDTWFYGGSFLKLKDLDTIKQLTLETKENRFTDVIILKPDSDSAKFSDRIDYISTLYWSKSEGLIRYDKKGGVYWELTHKYSP